MFPFIFHLSGRFSQTIKELSLCNIRISCGAVQQLANGFVDNRVMLE